jgi:hypothetical protein
MTKVKDLMQKRSSVVKKAEHGHKFAKKKANSFKNVEAKASKEYGSSEAGKKVAGAIFWKARGLKK